jgi:hypothetical protein
VEPAEPRCRDRPVGDQLAHSLLLDAQNLRCLLGGDEVHAVIIADKQNNCNQNPQGIGSFPGARTRTARADAKIAEMSYFFRESIGGRGFFDRIPLTRRQALALIGHDAQGHVDRQLAAWWGVTASAVAHRRRRGLAALTDRQRAAYLAAFPPRRGRPAKRRRKR